MNGGKVILFLGDNTFERDLEIANIIKNGERKGFLVEKISADNLAAEDLISSISAVSLLADKRLVIIRNLSENKTIWSQIVNVISRISDGVILCLVEDKLDKRAKMTKELLKIAEIKEFKNYTARNEKDLVEFINHVAKLKGVRFSREEAKFLIEWVGVDQWLISQAIDRLSELGSTTKDMIREFIPHSFESNVFEIIDLVFSDNSELLMNSLNNLRLIEGKDGGYRFFGLLVSHIFNLTALKIGHNQAVPIEVIASNIGANSWSLKKINNIAMRISDNELSAMMDEASNIDRQLKTSSKDPWDLIESFLLSISLGVFKK